MTAGDETLGLLNKDIISLAFFLVVELLLLVVADPNAFPFELLFDAGELKSRSKNPLPTFALLLLAGGLAGAEVPGVALVVFAFAFVLGGGTGAEVAERVCG